jgi:hypothetical protein
MASDKIGKSESSGDAFPGLKETLDAAVQVFRENEMDLDSEARKWAQRRRTELDPLVAKNFDSLCSNGCHPVGLAGSLFLAELTPIIVFMVRGVM